MNVRRSAAILALSTFVTIGFAQSGVPPASGNQEGASPDTSGAQTQQTAKHHRRHKHSSMNGATTNNNGTPPNSTALPSTGTAPDSGTTPGNGTTSPSTPPQR